MYRDIGLHKDFDTALPEPRQEILQDIRRLRPAALANYFSQTLFYADPPYHTHLRSLMNHAFTPRYVERLRPFIERTIDQLLDQSNGEMDVIRDLAYPLPVMVIAELIGLPAGDRAKFKAWSDDLFATLGTVKSKSQQILERAAQSLGEMSEYIKHLARRRRAWGMIC